MKAKPNSIAAAALLACCCDCALAQSSLATMYGIVDVAVEHITNTSTSGAGITRQSANTGSVPSRLGVRGSEDLGAGLSANFALEMGILPNSGAMGQGGRAFGRQSWVGLSGSWGAVSVGRQYTMLFWSLLDGDIFGPNIHGMGSIDPYIPNARADNSIAYKGTFSGLTAGATYSFGRDVVNAGPSPVGTNCAGENPVDHKACREWSALLKYDSNAWGVAAAVDELRGGPGAFGGLTSSSLTDRRSTVNGYMRFGGFKFAGGLLRRNNQGAPAAPRSDMWFVGVSYPVMPQVVLDGEFFRYDVKSSPNDANYLVARVTYVFSKRTAAYVSAAHVANKGASSIPVSGGLAGGNPPAGGGQTGIAVGIRHTF